MAKPPVSEQVQVNFRMPVALRDRIKHKAEAHGMSMNAKIVEALEYAFPEPRDVKDVIKDVATMLSLVEPDLREKVIASLKTEAESGSLSKWATAYAYSEKDLNNRFPWEED